LEHIESKSEPQTPPDLVSQASDCVDMEGGSKTSWTRILRHSLPHKVRQLLLEHDRFEQTSSEANLIRAQLIYERARSDQMASEIAFLRGQLAQHDHLDKISSELASLRAQLIQNDRLDQISLEVARLHDRLVKDDHFDRMSSELTGLRDQLVHERGRFDQEVYSLREQLIRERTRVKGIAEPGQASISKDVPKFPKLIFEAAAASKIAIVDVGAQDLVSEEHMYAPLQRAGATSVIGFEPLPDMGATRRIDPNVVMLNYFVGSGGPATFHVTEFDPASSLLEPNSEFLSQFVSLPVMCRTVSTDEVQTTRLDDVPEVGECDYLKIDVQGGELDVLKGAQRLLENVIAVHCEVEFAPLYRGQPLFAEIDMRLRSIGFELIDLTNAGYNRYQALPGYAGTGSRLLWAEAIYFKSPHLLAKQAAEKLLKAAYIAHVNHSMYDLAARFLAEFDKETKASTLSCYSAAHAEWAARAFAQPCE
jgi:FkbM family methyltransferase